MRPQRPIDTTPLYKPSRFGEIFHNVQVDELLGAGSAGPGKTMILRWDPFTQIMIDHERCRRASDHEFPLSWGESTGWCLYLRRQGKDLAQFIAKSKLAFERVDPGVKFVQASVEMSLGWIFSCGYHYEVGHCNDPDDWEQYQGGEYTQINFDELTQFEEEQYDQISARLRSSDPVFKNEANHLLKIRSCSNPITKQPKGETITLKNPFWVRDRFIEPDRNGNVIHEREFTRKDGRKVIKTWMYLPAKLHDNPDKEFVDWYEGQLLSLKPHLRKAYLDGDWYVTVGAHYADEWNPTLHICRPFAIPGHWKRFRSLDWGFKKQGTVLWWAMDEDENIFCEREYNFKGKLVPEVANDIKQIEKQLGIPWKNGRSQILGPADTQLWEQRGTAAKSMAQQFAECGVLWSQADKKSRVTNSQRFSARLLDHENETAVPGIVFFDTCRQCIKTIPSIPSDKSNPEVPQDGGEDHWHDAVLYACAYASHGKAGIAGRAPDDDEDEEPPEEPGSRGKWGYGSSVM